MSILGLNYSATVGLAELASANIVGYNTVTLKKGYNMIAVNFEDVASTAGISIQDLGLTIASGMTGGAGSATADMIQVYDAVNGTYTDYFLYNNPRQATNPKNGKWVTTETGFPAISDTAEVLPVGKGAWYCH